MNRLTLRTRLILGFALPIVMLIVVAFLGLRATDNVRAELSTFVDVDLPLNTALEEMKFAAARIISSTNEFILEQIAGEEFEEEEEEEAGGDPASIEIAEIEESVEAFSAAFDDYHAFEEDQAEEEQHEETLEGVNTASQEILDLANELVALSADEDAPLAELLEIRGRLENAEVEFLTLINALIEEESEELVDREVVIDSAVNASTSAIGWSIAATITLTVGLAVYNYQSISRPITALRATAARLTDGDLTARSNVKTADEIGELATAFNSMANSIEYRDKVQIARLEEQVEEISTARAEAERSNQVKSAFLASMSHELRTPLNAVINYTRFVMRGVMGPVTDEQNDTLNRVLVSSRHLLNLINDVLDMSKIESGSLNLFIEDDIDVNAILTSVVETAEGLLEDKPVELKTDIPDNLPRLKGDRQRILQIMLNIVSNACKFTQEGTIMIRARVEDGELVMSVTDTGPGVAPEDRADVFEPFKQTHSGLRKAGGTGLGMPISKNLAEAHGGRLWLDETAEKGATFTVALPLKASVPEPVTT